jgi:hypothetical protein
VRSALAAAAASHKSSRSSAGAGTGVAHPPPLILVHAGVYTDECLVIDSECTVVGAGKAE